MFGFGRFIFEEDIKFVFDSNFSDFLVLLLLKDELEHIDSVSFIMLEEFKEWDVIFILLMLLLGFVLALALFWMLILIGELNIGIFVLEF